MAVLVQELEVDVFLSVKIQHYTFSNALFSLFKFEIIIRLKSDKAFTKDTVI